MVCNDLVLLQEDAGWEEYFDYIFPDEEAVNVAPKLLQIAQMWKRKREEMEEKGE